MADGIERVGWGVASVLLGAGGCYFQVPTPTAPDVVVLHQATHRVAGDRDRGDVGGGEGKDAVPDRQLEYDAQMRRHFPDWQGSWCPLVLSFDGGPVRLTATPDVPFHTGGAVACASTDWPTARTPWLVRDLDASGTIDGGHELLGTGTRMPDEALAASGFAALAVLDGDGDGMLTPDDPEWSSLALWFDRNGNRKTDPGELQTLQEAGVEAIVVKHTSEPQCDARGNCMIERSTFAWVDHAGRPQTGAVIDIHLACRRAQR